jgi:hypothetical protein
MSEETIVRFKIISLRSTPEDISKLLGLPCDSALRIGERRGKVGAISKEHEWILNSGLFESQPLENHLEALLNRLDLHKEAIFSLSETNTVEVSCVIYCSSAPALNFPKSLIKKFEQLGAGLDVDLYFRR